MREPHKLIIRLTLVGHVIGLAHEHQRPDAYTYIDFRCENLIGYEEAKAEVSADTTDPEFAFKSADERIRMVYAVFKLILFPRLTP